MAANKLAVSYKPRNVAVGIEMFQIGSTSDQFDRLIGQTELGYIALYSNHANVTSIFYLPKGLNRKLNLIKTLTRKVKTFAQHQDRLIVDHEVFQCDPNTACLRELTPFDNAPSSCCIFGNNIVVGKFQYSVVQIFSFQDEKYKIITP